MDYGSCGGFLFGTPDCRLSSWLVGLSTALAFSQFSQVASYVSRDVEGVATTGNPLTATQPAQNSERVASGNKGIVRTKLFLLGHSLHYQGGLVLLAQSQDLVLMQLGELEGSEAMQSVLGMCSRELL